ncbi:MAG: LysR family transcriptional regulator [Alphaproteobacteria bacterium]|nr:LysR family transcriptional regulator [Alphaproteobacteria bacterium]
MDFHWDDLKLFLDVARVGGLNAAARATGASAATLLRRINALEAAIGEPLFVRSAAGYRLTEAGMDLRDRASEIEAGFVALNAWHKERHGERTVRISAGHWTAAFLAAHIARLWHPEDRFRIELVTANQKVDIGRREADLGLRNARPTEQWLAGRLVGQTTYALYAGRNLVLGVAAGMFVGLSGALVTPSARWLEAHHADRIGVRGNDAASIRELVAAGAGLSVFPCFVGDADPRLVRVAGLIEELTAEQWLVSHHDERHAPHVRTLAGRIATLIKEEADLFAGKRPQSGAKP